MYKGATPPQNHRFAEPRLSYLPMHPLRATLAYFATLLLPFGTVHAQYYAVKSTSATVRVEVPAAVVASFNKVFPVLARDTVVRWEMYDRRNSCYGVTLGKHGDYGKAAFDSVGTVTETLLEVPMSTLPKRVQRKVKKEVLPWLHKNFPHLTPPLQAYAYTLEAELRYYVIDFKNTAVPRRSRDWLLQPDGNYYPRGSPVFR
jgi:hypothetical protein